LLTWGALSLDEKSGLLLGLASEAFLRSESHGTHERILLFLFLRFPQPGGPDSCIYLPQEQGSPVIYPGIGFLECNNYLFPVYTTRTAQKRTFTKIRILLRVNSLLREFSTEPLPGNDTYRPMVLRFTECTVKMVSRATTYTPIFIKVGSAVHWPSQE
jgi:hypothetical protein